MSEHIRVRISPTSPAALRMRLSSVELTMYGHDRPGAAAIWIDCLEQGDFILDVIETREHITATTSAEAVKERRTRFPFRKPKENA